MPQISLAGRTALVTGASSGIGRACALALGAAGADVVVNFYGDSDAAEEVAGRIDEGGRRAIAHQADVGNEEQVRAMFARTLETFGTLHVLVANAGIQQDADLLDMSAQDWDSVLDTNLRGAFLCAREAAREFCRRGPEGNGAAGNMIFMSSVHDVIPWAGRANYAASKGGVAMLMKSLAQELGPEKIRVNAVSPGAIMTDINREAWETGEARRALLEKIPYRRIGEPEDVAKAVLWLACDESDYVHGHTLYIDGGMLLYPGFREGG
ncbi:MAG: glucose 1-dehydrogenase [Alphaproteobacteria bacterium]